MGAVAPYSYWFVALVMGWVRCRILFLLGSRLCHGMGAVKFSGPKTELSNGMGAVEYTGKTCWC